MQLDLLAFGPHPDDLELSCGGTLARLAAQGYKTGMVALTRGELGTRGSPELRLEEFSRAAAILGAAVHHCVGLQDGHLQADWESKLALIREIRRFRPAILLAPYWQDRHPDHENGSKLVREAAYLAGLKRIDSGEPAHRPFKVLFYPLRYEFRPSFIVDVTEFHERKLEAIRAYRSQFDHAEKSRYGSDETNISRPGFLEAVIARAQQYGAHIGVRFGEPFLAREPLRLDDPVKFFGPDYLNAFL